MLKSLLAAIAAAVLLVGLWAMYAPWTLPLLGWLFIAVFVMALMVQLLWRRPGPHVSALAIIGLGLACGLSGCAGLPGLGGSSNGLDFLKELNSHLDGCDRTYTGNTTPVPQLAVHIECKAKATPPAAPPATP